MRVDLRVKPSAGLGAYPGSRISLDDVAESQSRERWIKAQDRYARLKGADPASSSAEDSADPVDLQTTAASDNKVGQIKWVKGQ